MDALTLVAGIVLALILATLDSLVHPAPALQPAALPALPPAGTTSLSAHPEDAMSASTPSRPHKTFLIHFEGARFSPAMSIAPDGDPADIIGHFGLLTPRPTIFITGGASGMSEEDIALTREIVNDGIARFAEDHNITVIDGGTEAGVMQMIGDARHRHHYKFPLIGVCPAGKVSYPGYKNPHEEAVLEDGHSHFVLIEADHWGDESQMIVNLTRAIAGPQPMIGILINGGKIAEKDVYLATAQGEHKIPILVLDGSGRTATNIATAFKTGQAANHIIKAIIAGGDIRLTAINDGKEAMLKKLHHHFGV
ncbi:MAG: hypothetical protein MUE40_09340 [Anaerolineae bacterium]|jgi:hypothetical protein|nr:hypothetical protein [Anaerolineae bacterium]